MENETPLEPWFVSGLTEGEGCFNVSFSLRKKLNVGIETRPSFSISLNRADLDLLKKVHAYFRCGAIRYSKGDRTYKFECRSVGDLAERVNPHFRQYPLQGRKREDFALFDQICRAVRSNHHRSRDLLPQIIERAYQMNPSGKRRHEQRDLLKVLDELKV